MWLAAIVATVLTVALIVGVSFISATATAVVVPLAVIAAGIAALIVPGLLPEPFADLLPPPGPTVEPLDRTITAQIVFADCRDDGIRHRHEKTFKEHPEYLGLWQGQRQSTQFCISNPGLRMVEGGEVRLTAQATAKGKHGEPNAVSLK